MCSVWGYQKKVLDSLGWEFQTVVSCHVGDRNQTRVLWNSNQSSSSLSLFPRPCKHAAARMNLL